MDQKMTGDTTPPQYSPTNEPSQTDDLELPATSIVVDPEPASEQDTPTPDEIIVPVALEELWLAPVDHARCVEAYKKAKKDKQIEDIIARRRPKYMRANWQYLLSSSLLWFDDIHQVDKKSKEPWSKKIVPRGNVKLGIFKVANEEAMKHYVEFEVAIGRPEVDPLHANTAAWKDLRGNVARSRPAADPAKTEVEHEQVRRASQRFAICDSSPQDLATAVTGGEKRQGEMRAPQTPDLIAESNSAFSEDPVNTVTLDGSFNTSDHTERYRDEITEEVLFNQILHRAQDEDFWKGSVSPQDYDFERPKYQDAAEALGMATTQDVLLKFFEQSQRFQNTSGKWTNAYRNISLLFNRIVDPKSADKQAQVLRERGHQRPGIPVTKVFKVLFENLQRVTCQTLLDMKYDDRKSFVEPIFDYAPHTLKKTSPVLLLLITILTRKDFDYGLDNVSIIVSPNFYTRRRRRLLLELKDECFPDSDDSEIFVAFEKLKDTMHAGKEWNEPGPPLDGEGIDDYPMPRSPSYDPDHLSPGVEEPVLSDVGVDGSVADGGYSPTLSDMDMGCSETDKVS
ncbi:hypothetical protein ACET3X_000371 [Alternaria dauci]|uniref:Uncharacterized protein n=1 Tax=Alternaria dauci TaxID=48095 RepID=A0ABR3UWK6_9PLEO